MKWYMEGDNLFVDIKYGLSTTTIGWRTPNNIIEKKLSDKLLRIIKSYVKGERQAALTSAMITLIRKFAECKNDFYFLKACRYYLRASHSYLYDGSFPSAFHRRRKLYDVYIFLINILAEHNCLGILKYITSTSSFFRFQAGPSICDDLKNCHHKYRMANYGLIGLKYAFIHNNIEMFSLFADYFSLENDQKVITELLIFAISHAGVTLSMFRYFLEELGAAVFIKESYLVHAINISTVEKLIQLLNHPQEVARKCDKLIERIEYSSKFISLLVDKGMQDENWIKVRDALDSEGQALFDLRLHERSRPLSHRFSIFSCASITSKIFHGIQEAMNIMAGDEDSLVGRVPTPFESRLCYSRITAGIK